MRWVLPFTSIGMGDVGRVGGKNASLGEMIRALSTAGVKVPNGFATTAEAFRATLDQAGLTTRIAARLDGLDVDDVVALRATGAEIRRWIETAPLPEALERAIRDAYAALGDEVAVAVRSSATAEDLPDASFAGQQETFLYVQGIEAVLDHVRRVFASLYNDRAIAYRVHQGFVHADVALSAGIQRMVRSDLGAAGVMFTLDTESGFREAVFITAAWGLGETVVQGAVNPDEYLLYKPNLRAGHDPVLRRVLGNKAVRMVRGADGRPTVEETPAERRSRFVLDREALTALGCMALTIEAHYGRPMDIEWALDGETGELLIVQARPETVESRTVSGAVRYRLDQPPPQPRVTGRAIGARIGVGRVRVLRGPDEMHRVERGDVLVADMTDPDWEPIMKRAAAIVTDRGGRTCHAAIIARELGIPAVVGCGDASVQLSDGEQVTVSCAEGDEGRVYSGALAFSTEGESFADLPPAPVRLMLNVADPARAFDFAALPHAGVGLARLEFIINNQIGVHPLALAAFDGAMPDDDSGRLLALDDDVRRAIAERVAPYGSGHAYFVERLTEGVASIAAAFAPEPVIVRLSDFKSNEYAHLIGGAAFEPDEENPMLGFRGAARYAAKRFALAFAWECEALRAVRDRLMLRNLWLMVPFVRSPEEGAAVVQRLAESGLERGRDGLKIVMMCELPTNALRAEAFLRHFDGFSIGSNDLTQLTLGIDRDSALVAGAFDERDPAVKSLIGMAIDAAQAAGRYVGICGQAPSDYPEFAEWLVARGISSISLNPDALYPVWRALTIAADERRES
ncbi:MAG: phosphoenolpyruvate synthase [Thioalkalivibrionaceae bacterium]